MIADNFCFYLQNRLIQTSQRGSQWYSDYSPFGIPCFNPRFNGGGDNNIFSKFENFLNIIGLCCQLLSILKTFFLHLQQQEEISQIVCQCWTSSGQPDICEQDRRIPQWNTYRLYPQIAGQLFPGTNSLAYFNFNIFQTPYDRRHTLLRLHHHPHLVPIL